MNKHYSSIDDLFTHVYNAYRKSGHERFIILVGGCSRSGKTTLSNELHRRFSDMAVNAVSLNLDAWLIGVDERKPNSTVVERYEMSEIIIAVDALLAGETIYPPVYDSVSRKRLMDQAGSPLMINRGVLLIEGVIALCYEALLLKSHSRIFVNIPDVPRIKRLLQFYRDVKNLPRSSYKDIILARESEEVPFIKKTALNADIVFCWPLTII